MDITFLGTGAPLSPERATTGLLVTASGCAPLLVDTCGGFELARQLVRFGVPLASLRNVIVTHRHLDHAGGMQALLLANMPLEVYANADTHAGIATMTEGCFPEWKPHPDIRRHSVDAGDVREIGGFRVSFHRAEHRVETLAARIEQAGRVLAFSADTLPCAAVVEAAREADLFVCDALCAEADGEHFAHRARELMHPTAREAALMAREAGVRRLALVHCARFGTPELIRREAARFFDGEVVMPGDGDRLVV